MENTDLGSIPIAEDTYKPDLELLARYQAFSGEILRLALIGIAAFGFLLEVIDVQRLTLLERSMSGLTMLCMFVSGACALGHRYFSSDGMFHHLRLLRLGKLETPTPEQAQRREQRLQESAESRRQNYKRSWMLLGVASVALGLGVCALCIFIFDILVTPPPFRAK